VCCTLVPHPFSFLNIHAAAHALIVTQYTSVDSVTAAVPPRLVPGGTSVERGEGCPASSACMRLSGAGYTPQTSILRNHNLLISILDNITSIRSATPATEQQQCCCCWGTQAHLVEVCSCRAQPHMHASRETRSRTGTGQRMHAAKVTRPEHNTRPPTTA
jgi:hypothetical protein